MSAERGWIGEPQPEREWHTPGWLSEKGGPSHFHSGISSEAMSAEPGWISDPPPERERTPLSHEHKWRKMMGAAEPLPNQYDTEEAREAQKQYQETGTWQARQHVSKPEQSQETQ